MGLDMYLTGDKYLPTDWKNPKNDEKADGFRIKSVRLELGYWRKHPDLHGYIVRNFADDVDECQVIDLGEMEIQQIIIAIRQDELPHTTGFFFGESENNDEQKNEAIAIFENALKWLQQDFWHSVEYQASW